jgi:ribosomal protein S18 acetylase RimI-like enzyme
MGIGALANLGISKGMSLGRELFGFLLRSDLNVAKIAEWAGITMDTLKDAPPEALSAILERAARSGAIDPREANNINIQLAKEAQEAMPAMPTLKAQDAANKLSKQFGVNFDVSNHPTAYGNSTYVSGRIPGPGRTNVRVGFRLSDHETGDRRKATDDFLTIIDDSNVSAESLVAEVQSQIERALPKMQKISDDREAKTIAQSDALSRWSELSGDERGEIAVKFNETRPTRFNNVPWKNLTKQQKADFAVDGPLAKEAQEAMPAMPSIKKETRGSPENPYEVLTYLDETSGEPLGEMYLRKLRDGSNEVASVTVNPETRRQGVATALYNAAGISAPSDNITLDAFNFWKNRDPNSLPDSLYNYYDDLIGLEIPDMGLITDVRNNFASVKKGGISGPLYKNQLQDMGLIPKEPK